MMVERLSVRTVYATLSMPAQFVTGTVIPNMSLSRIILCILRSTWLARLIWLEVVVVVSPIKHVNWTQMYVTLGIPERVSC
jgi:hypothetical protein